MTFKRGLVDMKDGMIFPSSLAILKSAKPVCEFHTSSLPTRKAGIRCELEYAWLCDSVRACGLLCGGKGSGSIEDREYPDDQPELECAEDGLEGLDEESRLGSFAGNGGGC